MGTKYLYPWQVEESEQELEEIDRQIQTATTVPEMNIDTGILHKRRKVLRTQLEDGRPPPTTPDERDALSRKAVELEGEIRVGMPSHEDMRHSTTGTQGQHQRWQEDKETKDKIFLWKDILKKLDPTDTDPNYTSVERLRPSKVPQRTAPFKYYKGVDFDEHGQIIPGGKPIAEKIAGRTATAVMEPEPEMEPESKKGGIPTNVIALEDGNFYAACEHCTKTFEKDTHKKAAAAVRFHTIKMHPKD